MKDKLLLIRNQLKMGNRLSFAEAMLLQRAIDILVYGAGNASAQSPIDHGYRPECECSGCKATARICTELAGNSPVTPDGYALVPVEPTDEMIAAAMECDDVVFDSKDPTEFCVQYREIYCAMVDAAPKPEINNE